MNILPRPKPPVKRRRAEKANRAARVTFRVKGSNVEGVTYEGQRVYRKCSNCGKK